MTFVVSLPVSLLLLLLSCNFQVRSCAQDCKRYNDTLKSIDSLRQILVKLEDTIVFGMIQRSNYPRNSPLYDTSAGLVKRPYTSLFDFYIKQSESVQAQAGRYYLSEEENAFYPKNLPSSLVQPSKCTPVLHHGANSINKNDQILDMYEKWLLPNISPEGDDGEYVSTAAADLNILQALSKRIHYGNFVAESKFMGDPVNYTRYIRNKDRAALINSLTFPAVEQSVKKRVQDKMNIFSQDVDGGLSSATGRYKVDPKIVYQLYENYVINITKLVEVEYLLQRLK